MSERDLSEQLVKYLTDVHSIEEQALIQMRGAPRISGVPELAAAFERHRDETEVQEQRVREALEARQAGPSKLKDVAGKAGGLAMLAFAASQPDTPVKLVAHAYSYEHMEIAAYELLGLIATRAGDEELVTLANEIGMEEAEMAGRLQLSFDPVVESILGGMSDEEVAEQLDSYLADVHALEQQALQLLANAPALVGDEELGRLFSDHLEQTRHQEELVRARLDARGATPSRIEDAALRIGGLNVGGFFAAQPDTPLKLVGFAFAFEHIEAAAYELLKRIAIRAGDQATADAADEILAEEREAAARFRHAFDDAVSVGLDVKGVTA